jgi:DNA segregation ATPase FtsK/SpoIIIE, S-DNA-T family
MAAPTIPRAQQGGFSGFMARRASEAAGAALVAIAILLAVSLLGYDASDPSLNQGTSGPSTNPLGHFGASVADFGLQSLGLAAWIPVFILPVWGIRLILARGAAWSWVAFAALPVALLATASWLATLSIPESWPYWVGLGGFVGDFLLQRLERPVGPETYPTVCGVLALVTLVVASGLGWRDLWDGVRSLARLPFRAREPEPRRPPARPRWDQALDDRFAPPERPAPARASWTAPLARLGGLAGGLFTRSEPTPPIHVSPDAVAAAAYGGAEQEEDAGPPRRRRVGAAPVAAEAPAKPTLRPLRARDIVPGSEALVGGEPEPDELSAASQFQLPPLKFLAQPRAREKVTVDRQAVAETAKALEKVLDDFGVRGEIVDVKPGPVVTLYELEPAPGTRAARVISLADDIARSLCATSVRVAVVPGRNVIGIELPNDERETVYLRDLLASAAYEDTSAKLTLALGKDIGGDPVVVDLARMPHLLIAGTTGSGKSVAINAMILSLLYRLPPEQCKLILIDPKVIELSVYEDIPHLLAPVVTDPPKAVVALKWVVREMDERYRLMSHLGVRDIFTYNRRMTDAIGRGEQLSRRVQTGFEPGTGVPLFEQQPIEMMQMPLIVVVVDEVADLMLTAGKEIESAIQRLSQKARAAGIHLIVATQRPSVDVLTGVIKANLPSRISFRVSSKIDSRTVLGEPGAEQLLGQGDLLFMMTGERALRIHGPLVTEEEVERVVTFLRKQGQPDYVDAVTDEAALESGSGAIGGPLNGEAANGDDAQYRQALQIVAQEGKASTSFLQRKMRIGYNSAARLIERMENDGVISHPDHVGRRRVLLGEQDDDAAAPW